LLRDFVLFYISLFSILNPLSAIPLFVSLTTDLGVDERTRLTRDTSMGVFVVLLVSYAGGASLLHFFGISVASLRVAGGLVIFGMAWAMMQARMSLAKQTPEEAEEAGSRTHLAIVPLAMPILAGPGTISLMIIAAGHSRGLEGHLVVLAASLAVTLTTWVILLAANPIAGFLGKTGMNVAARLMGLILAATAVEFIASGLKDMFPGWAGPVH
jgi:MarC family membrane protein